MPPPRQADLKRRVPLYSSRARGAAATMIFRFNRVHCTDRNPDTRVAGLHSAACSRLLKHHTITKATHSCRNPIPSPTPSMSGGGYQQTKGATSPAARNSLPLKLIRCPVLDSRGGTRTPDPVINSHLLYQLSYSGRRSSFGGCNLASGPPGVKPGWTKCSKLPAEFIFRPWRCHARHRGNVSDCSPVAPSGHLVDFVKQSGMGLWA